MQNTCRIECVIMDWAGTAVDYGCFAPVDAFVNAFKEFDLHVTIEEVRAPMGMTKIEHIRQMLHMSTINEQFVRIYQRNWNEEDVSAINRSFEKHLFVTLGDFAEPIPGVVEIMNELRSQQIRIGSTTGYTGSMMDVVRKEAAMKGYVVDSCVTSDHLPSGRPAPYMIFQNMINLCASNLNQVVKVGDTLEDIREGVNAKVWTIGVLTGSSELGLSEKEFADTPGDKLNAKMEKSRLRMLDAGADYVINSIAELPETVCRINSILL